MKRTPRAALALTVLFSSPLTGLSVPNITSTKDDATAAAARKVAGDSIDYTIQISNAAGATDASGVTLTDATPANTTLVPASVNVSPLAFDDAYAAVGNTMLRVGNPAATTGPSTTAATKVTVNDTEFLGDQFTISTFQASSANGGTVAMVTAGVDAGSFSYLPPAGFEGVDTFTYTITDDGSTGFPALTGVGTVSITVSEVVWYVDDSAAAGGTGRSNAPLQSLATLNNAASDPDEADDYIFVYSGNYSGAFTLEAGQRLIGEPAGLTVAGLTIAAGGTRPALSHNTGSTVTLSTNNTIRSMNFSNSAGHGITGSAVGTLTLADFDVTVTGGSALSLTTSGTVTATGSDNDLSSTNGTALNVANVNIAAAGLTFKSISAGSAAGSAGNGITLDTTGSAGGLTVTGNGAVAGSGGTIQHKTGGDNSLISGIGIFLNNTTGVSLSRMQLNDFDNFAIRGHGVTNFTLLNSVINGNNGTNSTADVDIVNGEDTIRIINLLGTALIDGCFIGGGYEENLRIINNTGTLNRLTVNNSTIGDLDGAGPGRGVDSADGDDNITFAAADGTHVQMNGTFTNNILNNARGDVFQAANSDVSEPAGTMDVVFRGNKVTNNHPNIVVAGGGVTFNGTGAMTYDISNNTFRDSKGHGLNVFKQRPASGQTGGTWAGTIFNNRIGVTGVGDSGGLGNGLNVEAQGNGTHTTLIKNNQIFNWNTAAIKLSIVDANTSGPTALTLNATVIGNTCSQPDPVNAFAGFHAVQGAVNPADATTTLNLKLGGAGAQQNNFLDGDPANSTDVAFQRATSPIIGVFRLSQGASGVSTPVETVVRNNNVNTPTTLTVYDEGVTVVGTDPALPPPIDESGSPPPLLFAPGPAPAAPQATAHSDEEPAAEQNLSNATAVKAVEAADHGLLKLSDLDPLLSAAIARWEASGLTGDQLLRMQRMTFTVEEMPGMYLGQAQGCHITLDANAAGNRWFIDRTPREDNEFTGSSTRLAATANGGAAGRVDALTTIVHELGHAVGLDDSYLEADRDRIMYGFLHLSERRLPRNGEAQGAMVHNHYGKPHTHYLAAPITIGTLPPGKTVTVVYRTTVNAGITAPSVTNQGTVSGTNFSNVSTDDLPQPGAAANATVTVIEVPPVVSNFARTTAEDTVLNFTAANFTGAYTDANLDPLTTVRITSLPANGTLKLVAANVTLNQDIPAAQLGNLNYTPAGDYNGADSFNWNASDGVLFAVTGATVNLTVTEVNDPPTATADPQPNVAEDAPPIVIVASSLTTNDSKGPANESTQTLTVTAVSAPAGGTVALNAGNITFTLTPDFNGPASFTYTVSDNGTTNGAAAPLTANGTVSFTVTEVNDAPVAVDDTRPNVAEDAAPIVFAASTLATNDTKGAANESAQTLTVTAVNNPTGGTVVLNAGNITFTLTPNYNGPASFEYTVADNGTTNGAADPKTDVGLVNFTVTSVNDDPLAVADTIQRYPTQSVKVPKATLLSNDTDGDGGTPAFVSVSAASANGGTVTSDATQVFYTPAVGFTGTDTFTYTINDGQGGTANGTVNVAIIPDESAGMSVAKVETLGDGSVRVTFAGIPGRTYRVQSSETMAPGSWTTRATLPADAQGRFQFTDPPPLPPTRYYRSVQP